MAEQKPARKGNAGEGAALPEIEPVPMPAPTAAGMTTAEFCLRAADLHLQRSTALAGTEWKVSLAFWGVLLASGLLFISYTSQSSPPMTLYIAHSDALFLLPYLISATIFVFGFSVNQAKSIVEERTRYRYYLNEAARLVGHPYKLPDANPEAKVEVTKHNRVWAQKLASTFLFVTGIWAAAQWLAHGKLLIDAAIAAPPKHAPDLSHIDFGPRVVACAFFDCNDRGYWVWSDVPELGMVIWLISAIATAIFFTRAQGAGKR